MSEKDKAHPRLASVTPMAPKRTLILGADGQLGKALRAIYSGDGSVEFADRTDFDLLNPASFRTRAWQKYSTIINAAAYTDVDAAETEEGRQAAWALNVTAVAELAKIAVATGIVLVQVSSDYVFDGSRPSHDESEGLAPLGVYAQTKAAADAVVSVLPKHYIIRTSWVIGEGPNFVRTMASLAEKGITPSVVHDQIGRLTFAGDLAAGIRHLLDTQAPYGTYNLTNGGDPQSWADIARDVFELIGADRQDVTGVSTEQYFKAKEGAPRPLNSVLVLDKIVKAGFRPAAASERLREYIRPKG
ncbi:dTDP-4-dehydrorhamnose reductase [Arthrobacter sp. W4I7]|nr:dTDP-4-dehydrorhamnose reductase [Arthrobacter sp. W4I7]